VIYDFVIVGGGSAGCVLANRLSADGNTRVLVLEAGRPDRFWDLYVQMPAALAFPIGNPRYDWMYRSEPESFLGGRRIYHARGKLLGGSTSINGMIFQRGNALDYERWATDRGLERWGYAHCLPYFKRMESCLTGAESTAAGGYPARNGAATGPLEAAFFDAIQQAGYQLTDDVSGRRQEGLRFDRTIHHGRRVNATRSYLRPARGRPNLEVRCRAFVTRVIIEHSRATGVEVVERGRARIARAREVILCGGAFNSPQLLELSGVGNAAELEAVGVPAVHDLPGVGQNLQDHLEVYVQHAATRPVDQPALEAEPAAHRPRWLAFRSGPAAGH
jgi:choline dehydrogenase